MTISSSQGFGQVNLTKQEFFDFDYKASCRVATTGAITLSGAPTIDGVSVVVNDRVLVKNQGGGASHATNGIYVCVSGAWTRSTDFGANSEVHSGSFVHISEGTANGDKSFVLTTNDPITLGTTALTFIELTANVADNSITYAKIQDVSTNRILGRDSVGSGVVEEIAPANLRTMIDVDASGTDN
jgi:phage-related tail fiber protein